MTTNAILEIKNTELKAKEIIEKAHKEILILKEENKNKLKEENKRAMENAFKAAEELKEKYRQDAKEASKPIFDKAQEKIEFIQNIDEIKLMSVVDSIVERIVNSNGNS